MDPRLQDMLDHYEITRVLSEYAHGCDRGDYVAMAGVFAEDSWDDHGATKCPGQEYARRAMLRFGEHAMLAHLLGQALVTVNGEEAGAETYFVANTRGADPDGGEVLNQIGGRYVDRLVREGGRWKVKHRQVVREWSISWPITRDWLAGIDYAAAHRSNADPSCAVLGRPHSGIPGPNGEGLPPPPT